jgi:hypothetical protein
MNCHLPQEILYSGGFAQSLFYGHGLVSDKLQSSAATLLLPPVEGKRAEAWKQRIEIIRAKYVTGIKELDRRSARSPK